jgi:hypothetical protein
MTTPSTSRNSTSEAGGASRRDEVDLEALYGFRLMAWDLPAIALCAAATWFAWPALGALSLMLPFVLGHFFLFCNVFRIRRSYELLWAAVFVSNVAVFAVWLEAPVFWQMAAVQLPVTILVISLELRSARYHGVFAERINPDLETYLERRSRELSG